MTSDSPDRAHALDLLRKHIRELEPMPDDEFAALAAGLTFQLARKKSRITRQGEVCRHLAFVASGCVRSFRLDQKGSDYTLDFAFAASWLGDTASFHTSAPSPVGTEVLEDAALLTCSKAHWDRSVAEIPSFARWYRLSAQQSYAAGQQRRRDASNETLGEQYRRLVTRAPDIIARMSQVHIASYLGIKPPVLSLLRQKLTTEKHPET